MKYKTSELMGGLLDAAVAKAIGLDSAMAADMFGLGCPNFLDRFTPSTSWLHGGPIIEREFILLDVGIESGAVSYILRLQKIGRPVTKNPPRPRCVLHCVSL